MAWKKALFGSFMPMGLASYVHNPTHEHGKLGLRATTIVFI